MPLVRCDRPQRQGSCNASKGREACKFSINHFNPTLFSNFFLQVKHGRGEWICMECDYESYFPGDLLAHVVAAGHNEYPFIICPSCTEDVDIKSVERHYGRCVRALANPRRKGPSINDVTL